MKNRILASFAVLAIAFAGADFAQGQGLGAHLGFEFDGSDPMVGLNGTLPLGLEVAGQKLILNGNLDYFIVDNFDWVVLGANLLYPFNMDGSFKPYAGGGILISFFSYDSPDFDFDFDFSKGSAVQASETDFGIAITGGAEYALESPISPFGEAFLWLKDGSTFGLRFGVRYLFGN